MDNKMSLQSIVQQCGEAKEVLKEAKNKEKKYCDLLKDELEINGITKQAFPEIDMAVSYTETVKSTINEQKLVELMINYINNTPNEEDALYISKCLKKITIVDEDILQDLIYTGYIDLEDIQPAYDEKVTKTLRVKNTKGGK